jgi:hypothetical protein
MGGGLQRVAAAPDMGHVYVIDGTQPLPPGTGLTEFTLGGDGALTASGSIVQAMFGLTVHPDSNFIFTSSQSNDVHIVRALPGGGIQDSGATINVAAGNAPTLAMDPLGEFVVAFVSGIVPPKIGLLRFDPAGPAVTLLNPPVADLPCGSNQADGVFHPTGQFVYVVCTSGPVNPIFRLEGRDSTPALTLADQFSFPVLPSQNALGVAIPRNGKFLYWAAVNRTVIDGFSIDPATGTLSPLPGSPFDVTGVADDLEGPLAAY